MATKKKASEDAVDTPSTVTVVAREPFTIVWGNGVYDFPDASPRHIPEDLYEYLARNGKVEVAQATVTSAVWLPPTDEVTDEEVL